MCLAGGVVGVGSDRIGVGLDRIGSRRIGSDREALAASLGPIVHKDLAGSDGWIAPNATPFINFLGPFSDFGFISRTAWILDTVTDLWV